MSKSGIEWTDETDNIIVVKDGGWWCRKLSPGCDLCYAEETNDNAFFKGNHLPYTGKPPELHLRREMIARWQRQRVPRKHFVASMTDVFGEWVERAWQFEFLDGMLAAPLQTFQLLTKRAAVLLKAVKLWMAARGITTPPKNIWLGFTAENQKEFDRRWKYMKELAEMGWTVFVSCEPLLGRIVLPDDFLAFGSQVQVIAGGESGKHARPVHPDWIRGLRDQCLFFDVPFFFKQWGEWIHETQFTEESQREAALGAERYLWSELAGDEWAFRVGKKKAGRRLDGGIYSEFPRAAYGTAT